MLDWSAQSLVCELQVAETTRDVCFLHNELFFAAAQKKYVYIYDKRGVEVAGRGAKGVRPRPAGLR